MPSSLKAASLSFLALLGLANPESATYQGYAEGEYVLAAPQIAGTLTELNVRRGQKVKEGEALFALEHAAETAALEQASAKAERSQATLEDLLKAKWSARTGRSHRLRRDQAKAAFDLATITYERDLKQLKASAVSQAAVDTDKANMDQARARLDEAEAAIASGVKASAATTRSARPRPMSRPRKPPWRPIGGSTRNAARPPPTRLFSTRFTARASSSRRVRPSCRLFFAAGQHQGPVFRAGSQTGHASRRDESPHRLHRLQANPVPPRTFYVSPKAEYTPPELYNNRDNRERLLFMLEATPDATPEKLHPASRWTSACPPHDSRRPGTGDIRSRPDQEALAPAPSCRIAPSTCPTGAIYGFLGPNGSGKTTTIRMLRFACTPDGGEGTCLGFDIRQAIGGHQAPGRIHAAKVRALRRPDHPGKPEFIARLMKCPTRRTSPTTRCTGLASKGAQPGGRAVGRLETAPVARGLHSAPRPAFSFGTSRRRASIRKRGASSGRDPRAGGGRHMVSPSARTTWTRPSAAT